MIFMIIEMPMSLSNDHTNTRVERVRHAALDQSYISNI